MLTSTLLCFALTVGSPQPADTYYSDMSPETAQHIMECVLNEDNSEKYLDFNGDNVINIADYVGVTKRYQDNCTYGNEITVDSKAVETIVEENYLVDAMYWEFNMINGEIKREFEITASEITTARIYIELSDYSTEFVEIEINPFTECVRVTS